MKIADIPQLIHVNQATNCDFEEIKPLLKRFKESYGLNLDPDFQRPHVWDENTKVKFVEYILRGGTVPPLRFNSPAFGGHTQEKHSDLNEDVVLVDGKQRLNAVLEFMDNKLEVFGGVFLNEFDNPLLLLRRAGLTYQVNKLQTKKELYRWYLEMNEGQIAHTNDELDRVRKMLNET